MTAKLLSTWTEFTDFNLKRQAMGDAFSTNGEKGPMAPAIGRLLASVTLCFLFYFFAL
jgi:hypothetical protein